MVKSGYMVKLQSVSHGQVTWSSVEATRCLNNLYICLHEESLDSCIAPVDRCVKSSVGIML